MLTNRAQNFDSRLQNNTTSFHWSKCMPPVDSEKGA